MKLSLGSAPRSDPSFAAVEIRHSPPRAEWPAAGLDIQAIVAEGWRPSPFREFILKVHGRCNLSCPHCYIYESADRSWRSKPQSMDRHTVVATAHRIAEHARDHSLPLIRVIFHGGEPLLAGVDALVDAVVIIREAVAPETDVDFVMQTNGVLLTERVLRALLDHQVRVGVSLDGSRDDHDRRRHNRRGDGSYDAVADALVLLRQAPYRTLFAGLLCTIDLDSAPLQTYEALLAHSPPTIDFLLPHGNWSDPPARRDAASSATPYADWLITVFDHWYSAPIRPIGIRFFEEIINLVLGGQSRSETIGLSPVGLLVVDTDGSMEQVDILKSSYAGAAAVGLDVFSHPLDQALTHPAITARQIGRAALSDKCVACANRDICGGGLYPHRYRAGTGFRNPSVYCPDLFRLTSHIQGHVRRDVRALVEP